LCGPLARAALDAWRLGCLERAHRARSKERLPSRVKRLASDAGRKQVAPLQPRSNCALCMYRSLSCSKLVHCTNGLRVHGAYSFCMQQTFYAHVTSLIKCVLAGAAGRGLRATKAAFAP